MADFHTGWDFLGSRPSKSYSDSTWMVRNTPMVKSKSAGTLASITANSRAGKAFVLGEYTMPWPNQYIAEQVVMLSAYAAFQDWDGLVITPFGYYRDDLFADSLRNPFHSSTNVASIANNPAILSLTPTASKLFREALVQPTSVMTFLRHDPNDLWLAPTNTGRGNFGVDGPFDNNVATSIGIRQHFGDTSHYVAARYPYLSDTLPKHTDTGELTWDETNGLFTIDAPMIEGGAGFFGADTLRLKQLSLSRKDAARDMLSFFLVSLDSLPIRNSSRQLLTLSTRAQNTGLTWVDSLGFGRNWGTAPVIMSAAKHRDRTHLGLRQHFRAAPRWQGPADRCKTRDVTGQRLCKDDRDRPAADSIGVVRDHAAKRKCRCSTFYRCNLDVVAIDEQSGEQSFDREVFRKEWRACWLSLTDDLGRCLAQATKDVGASSWVDWQLDLTHVPSGHYLVRAESASGIRAVQLSVVK